MQVREMVGGCCVCSDDSGWSENPLVYCDGQSCNVAVHQACYGIVTVPTGPWFCCKCESQDRSVKVKCELCPSRYGALKRTDNQGWAHVVCALYIPEVRFGNVSTMEPIQLYLIPPERFNKTCYICEEKGKSSSATVGACMQCNRAGCKQQFHVTCAQSLGLLCEEAGNYLDNVKYCGYCQHHYSKLKKGGNVKTIPPYKPVSENHNSDSNSEKESSRSTPPKSSPSHASSSKRRSGSSGKGSSKTSISSKASSSSQQKTGHSNSKGSIDKQQQQQLPQRLSSSRGAKSDESSSSSPLSSSDKVDKREPKSEPLTESDKELKDKESRNSRKRKCNSRTPTPVQSEVSVVVRAISVTDVAGSSSTTINSAVSAPNQQSDKKTNSASVSESNSSSSSSSSSSVDKLKKLKLDPSTQSIISNQPVVALTSISKISSPATTSTIADSAVHGASPPSAGTTSIIQTAQGQGHQQQQSLVVSVPLANTNLSPHHTIVGGSANSLSVMPFVVGASEKSGPPSGSGSERATPVTPLSADMINLPSSNSNHGLITSEMSGGGLKITYERQSDSINTEVDMELELDTPSTIHEVPIKRTRSQSSEKTERSTRGKKRSSNGSNGLSHNSTSLPATLPKRLSRSQFPSSPSPAPSTSQVAPPGAFASVTQDKMKDSPPNSPDSESQSTQSSCSNRPRVSKGRKSAPAAVNVIQSVSKEEKKDIKLFQNGGTAAPHMLGNQLNPTSNMHQKMNDHLTNELEAHSVYHNSNDAPTLVGPQMPHRVVPPVRTNSSNASGASSSSGLSSMLYGSGGAMPQSLDELLERQWEQGSQFLMEQAHHFDIASLLSALHRLQMENMQLEDRVNSLLLRRDHLLAVNARLAIPLTGQHSVGAAAAAVASPAPAATPHHGHTVNNIHPNMSTNHGDVPRSRHSSSGGGGGGGAPYDRYQQNSISLPTENGLADGYGAATHRDSLGSGQRSPNVRHSTPYPNNGLLRQFADAASRSMSSRSHPYAGYERPPSSHSTSSSSQQMVIRRDRERDQDMFGHGGSQPS